MSHTAGPEPRWLNEEELDSWKSVMAMFMNVPAVLDAQLQRDSSLTLFAYLVLVGLSDAPEHTMPMSRLAAMSNGSLSRLSHAVSSLERKGWIIRYPSPENGRVTVATLTDAGQKKLEASAPGHVDTVRTLLLDPIGPDGLHNLRDAARLILDRLDAPRSATGETPECCEGPR